MREDILTTKSDAIPKIMRSPRDVDIEITSKCNLRCRYCYYFDNPYVNYRDLSAKEWLQFFNELGRIAVMNVGLAGGEPFARNDLQELLEGIVHNKMRFHILSNGTLINDQIAEFIYKTHRCDFVQISIDGSSAEVHDTCRGQGSFEGAVRGIKILQHYDIPVAVRVTLHHYNIKDLDKIAKFLLIDLGLPGFSTNSAGYIGSCRSNTEVLLTREDRQMAIEKLLQLYEEYDNRITADAGPLADAHHWKKMELARAKSSPSFTNGGYLKACGCPFRKISVRADGIITPCSMLAHVELGRINRDSFQDIWLRSPALNALRMRQTIPLTVFEFCKGCEYIPYCTGNCPGIAYNLIGEINHPNPDDCLRRFLVEGGEIP
jgi:SynChlorMet cassette radical SAM/SPASM protein ScmE